MPSGLDASPDHTLQRNSKAYSQCASVRTSDYTAMSTANSVRPAADRQRPSSHASLADRNSIELQVQAERVRLLYRNAPAALPVNALLGGTLVAITAGSVGLSTALAWYVFVLLAVSIRLFLWLAFRRAHPSPTEVAKWSKRFVATSLISGMAWGAGSIFLFAPDALVQQLTVAATVVCLAAGITASTLGSIQAIYAFLFAGVAPYAVVFALQGTIFHGAIAFMILVFMGVAILARGNARMFSELITLRLEIAEQRDLAEQANLAKSKFLASASHDLRQPLHAMTLLADALEGRLRDETDNKTLASLQDSLAAMRKLLNALLDISRLDAGIVEPRIRDVRLAPLFARLQSDFAPPARQKDIGWRCASTTLVVRSDPVLLEDILRNLITNAIRYTEHGAVSLSCRDDGGKVFIEVEDTGIGIAPEQQREIFREFLQLGNPERDAAKGLGLGLAIVERLAKLLEHRIELRSERGKGSCFTVILPLGYDAAVEETDVLDAQLARGIDIAGMSVLVIDDQPAGRDSMRILLERWHCKVNVADSEDTAVAAVRESASIPELIIADYRLRADRTGAQAIERLRSEFDKAIPALIVTGDTAPERLREAAASGAMLMHKPVPPGRLRAYLRTVRREHPVVR